MRFFILTDLEGVVGVDQFSQTRGKGVTEIKLPGMKQLAREVNACVEGIKDVYPDAEIDVWDGHGSGGLLEEDVQGAQYIGKGTRPYLNLQGFDGMLFVGQHAMAGTVLAPLCHTYSSLDVSYYKLNGIFIGEFGARALIAGFQGVPTIYLSGDDKAVAEAKMFIPEIITTTVKQGRGLESAIHLDPRAACAMIRRDAARSVRNMQNIPPFTAITPPYTMEIRKHAPVESNTLPNSIRIDERTYSLKAASILDFTFL
jgi:D-amino peptidase